MIGSSLESGLRDQIVEMVRGQLNQLYHSFRNEVTQARIETAPASTSESTESEANLAAMSANAVALGMPTADSGLAAQTTTDSYISSGNEDACLDWESLESIIFDFA